MSIKFFIGLYMFMNLNLYKQNMYKKVNIKKQYYF